MITRLKALIAVSGDRVDEIMPILGNHEALVEITSDSEISKIWKLNKTPIINANSLSQICRNYIGPVLFFNADLLLSSNSTQPEITNIITQFCYNNKIEPGEFKVKNTANNSSDGCFLCEIARHPGLTTEEYNLSAKLVDMVIYETEHFVVIPGLGPLAPGYLMIMTKEHFLSLAQIPSSWHSEYHEIERDIALILKEMYGKNVAFYEHGTGPSGAVGLKSIVHMHVHVMLGAFLDNTYKEMFSMHPVCGIKQLASISYFTYKWRPNGTLWVTDDPEVYLQRQVHRQIYAERMNLANDQFNWRKTSFDEQTKTNVWQLYMFLSKSLLPQRIKERTQAFTSACKDRFYV